MYLFISGGEIFIVLLIVVMLFGSDKLPEIARGLGKGMRQIKDATDDIKREIRNSAEKHDIDLDMASKVKDEFNKVKDNVEDFTNPIKKTVKENLNDFTDAVNAENQEIDAAINDETPEVKEDHNNVNNDADDLTGSVKRSL
jgi:sec-independent protein translocase protein TatA